MAEKMTAVMLIIVTIVACAAIPTLMIILTSPKPHMLYGVVNEMDLVREMGHYFNHILI